MAGLAGALWATGQGFVSPADMAWTRSGDLVVMCVDDAVGVYREVMAASRTNGEPTAFTDPGELAAPEG